MRFSAKTTLEYGLKASAASSVSVLASIQFLNWSPATPIDSGWERKLGLAQDLHAARRRLPSTGAATTPASIDKDFPMSKYMNKSMMPMMMRSAARCTVAFLAFSLSPASAATLSRSMDVKGSPSAVWSAIGPFCAIKEWLPPVGACIEDGKSPPTRTLVTKDGKAAFVETQTARNDAEFSYSYAFLSSPLPVTNYTSTIKVTAKGDGFSTITWTGSYTPDQGKEKAASEALNGVYEAGLAEIKARLAK